MAECLCLYRAIRVSQIQAMYEWEDAVARTTELLKCT